MDASCITTMQNLFYNCEKLKSVRFGSKFDTKNTSDMSNMFANCKSLTSIDFGNKFTTSGASNMSGMFQGCEKLASLDLNSSFDTSKAYFMNDMFKGCKALKSLDLSNWNTKHFMQTNNMFKDCQNLQTIVVSSKWDMSSIKTSENMFYGATKIRGQRGTGYNSAKLDSEYARLDYGQNERGYLTPNHTIFNGASLTLDGDIGVNIFADLGADAVKVVVAGPNDDFEFSGEELEALKLTEGDYAGLYKFTYRVSSIQANEKISIKVYDKYNNTIALYNSKDELLDADYGYAVNDYIANYDFESENTDLNNLVFSLDEYCKAAENYFCDGANTITVADPESANYVKDEEFIDYGIEKKGNPEAKIALILNSETAIRIKYLTTPDATEMKLIDADENETTIEKEDDGCFYIRNISADKLATSYKVQFGMKQFSNLSALSYGYAVLDGGSTNPDLIALVKSLYQYAKAAEAYKAAL